LLMKVCLFPILILLVGLLAGCATGSAVITGQQRPPIPIEDVRLFSSPPSEPYEEIGLITANSFWSWGWNEQAEMDTATRELKAKAAKIGANGVILRNLGWRPTSNTGVVLGGGIYSGSTDTMRTIDGVAIYLPRGGTKPATPQ
jgi:hypothetical protein